MKIMKKNTNRVIRTTMAAVAVTGLVLATGCNNDTEPEPVAEIGAEKAEEATATEEKAEASATEKESEATTAEEKAEASTEEASSRTGNTTTVTNAESSNPSGSHTGVSSGSSSATGNTTASTPSYSIAQGITDEQLQEYWNSLDATTETEAAAQSPAVATEASSGGSTATEHTHNWIDVTTNVYREAEGHYETVCVAEAFTQPKYEAHTVCYGCGFDYDATNTRSGDHVCLDGSRWSYGTDLVQVGTFTTPAIYEEQWVVDKEAWVETVVTGQRCSSCGATR